jgi:hypothetical protein
LDLGAGQNRQEQICSELGIKQLLIDLGYPKSDTHNVRRRQVDILDFESVTREINSFFDDDKVDCVVSIGNIEHLNKSDGFLLLENIEKLARKLIILRHQMASCIKDLSTGTSIRFTSRAGHLANSRTEDTNVMEQLD